MQLIFVVIGTGAVGTAEPLVHPAAECQPLDVTTLSGWHSHATGQL